MYCKRLRKWTADLGKHGLETWNLRLRHRLEARKKWGSKAGKTGAKNRAGETA